MMLFKKIMFIITSHKIYASDYFNDHKYWKLGAIAFATLSAKSTILFYLDPLMTREITETPSADEIASDFISKNIMYTCISNKRTKNDFYIDGVKRIPKSIGEINDGIDYSKTLEDFMIGYDYSMYQQSKTNSKAFLKQMDFSPKTPSRQRSS